MLKTPSALPDPATLDSTPTRTVALTFDDLPLSTGIDAAEARQVNDAILAVLANHHAPAMGFVTECTVQNIGEPEGRKILRQWLDQGLELGNHTFSHPDLNNISVDQFKNEVLRGEASITQLQDGKRPRYFRFPFNHTGNTKEKHDAVAAFLKERGYIVAPCTVHNSDYEFARAHNVMLAKHDKESVEKLQSEYLAYTAVQIDYYDKLHNTVFGREIPHVMLLHVNRFNADMLDQILTLFEDRHYRFVNLATALSDAAYQIPDTVRTSFGPMWGYRWGKELGVQVNGRLELQAAGWVLKYGL